MKQSRVWIVVFIVSLLMSALAACTPQAAPQAGQPAKTEAPAAAYPERDITLIIQSSPGGGSTAVMLGALMLHGLRPGPLLFQNQPEFVWGFIASMYIGNILLLLLNMPLISIWVSLLRIPYNILMPGIVSLSAIGVLATDNSLTDVWVMIVFGILGYLMRKLSFPQAPMALGFIIGPLVEKSLRQSLVMSRGSAEIFFTRPITTLLLAIAIISLFMPAFRSAWKRYTDRRHPKALSAAD